MSQSLGFSCNSVIADMVAGMENGTRVVPRFFADMNCTVEWPPPGDPMPLLNAPHDVSEVCPSNRVNECPMPFISVMLIPDGYVVEFTSSTHPHAAYPGQINLASRLPNPNGLAMLDRNYTADLIAVANKNLWIREGYADQPKYPWGDASARGSLTAPCALNNASKVTDLYGWLGGNNLQPASTDLLVKRTIISCGSPFWPSFIEASQSLQVTSDSRWDQNDGNTNTAPDGNTYHWNCLSSPLTKNDWLTRGIQSFIGRSYPLNGTYSMDVFGRLVSIQDEGACFTGRINDNSNTFQPPTFTTIDCAAPSSVFFDSNATQPACGYPGNDEATCRNCSPQYQIKGTVQSFTIKAGDWDMQEFLWCIADPKDKPTFYDYPLQRYQTGSAFCDKHVTELCQDTGIVQQNPKFAIACQCILQQQKMEVEYAGLDIPAQCFLNVCDGSTDGVYRTSGQQRGCTAKICQQIIALNGSGISSNGTQELECNNKVYNVQDEVTNAATGNTDFDPNVLAPKVSSGFHLGREFYVALGFLIIVFFLLLLWGLHRWTEQRAAQQYKKEREAALLAKVISYTPPTESYGATDLV